MLQRYQSPVIEMFRGALQDGGVGVYGGRVQACARDLAGEGNPRVAGRGSLPDVVARSPSLISEIRWVLILIA